MTQFQYKVLSFKLLEKPIVKGTKKQKIKAGMKQEHRTGLLGGGKIVEVPVYEEHEVPNITGFSNTESDVQALTKDMEEVLNKMAAEGWKVISIEPILRGQYSDFGNRSYGYSLTDVFVVVLEKQIGF
jgi:hypothetical protein